MQLQQPTFLFCNFLHFYFTINRKGLDEIRGDVEKLDVSAMQKQFAVAKYALLEDFDKVNMYLEETIDKDIPAWCVDEWPLLKQYRSSSQYQDFVSSHRDLFETKGYEPNKETVGLNEDEISVLEEEMKKEVAITME